MASRRKLFTSSPRWSSTHYDTLGIPRDATKGQIKSSFYKLSKKYHPDLNPDPKSVEHFHSIRESYALLSDDRKRRAYDRVLVQQRQHGEPHHSGESASSYWSHEWSYETRHRRATHAWESPRRSGTSSWTRPGHTHARHPRNGPSGYWHYDPSVRRTTGQRTTGSDSHLKDSPNSVSGEWRAFQVIIMVVVIATLGGRWSAGAS